MQAASGERREGLSRLGTNNQRIDELDINPFIVGKMGEESFAADARIQLAPGGEL
jgi:hypothetical protein